MQLCEMGTGSAVAMPAKLTYQTEELPTRSRGGFQCIIFPPKFPPKRCSCKTKNSVVHATEDIIWANCPWLFNNADLSYPCPSTAVGLSLPWAVNFVFNLHQMTGSQSAWFCGEQCISRDKALSMARCHSPSRLLRCEELGLPGEAVML